MRRAVGVALALWCATVTAGYAAAPPIARVMIEGNARVDDAAIRIHVQSRAGGTLRSRDRRQRRPRDLRHGVLRECRGRAARHARGYRARVPRPRASAGHERPDRGQQEGAHRGPGDRVEGPAADDPRRREAAAWRHRREEAVRREGLPRRRHHAAHRARSGHAETRSRSPTSSTRGRSSASSTSRWRATRRSATAS